MSCVKAFRVKGDEPIRLTVRNPSTALTSVVSGGRRLAAMETIELPPLNDQTDSLARLDLDVTFAKGAEAFLRVDRKVEVEIRLGSRTYRDVLYPDTRGKQVRYRVLYEDSMPGLVYCHVCDEIVIAERDGRCRHHR